MKKLAACVVAYAPPTNHVLLGKHKTRGWMIPGGKNEGEEIIQTAYREFKEETGMPLSFGTLEFLTFYEHDEWLAMIFLLPVWCEPKFLLAPTWEEQFDEWKWFPLDALPDGMYKPSQDVLQGFRHDLQGTDGVALRHIQEGHTGQPRIGLPERRALRVLRRS